MTQNSFTRDASPAHRALQTDTCPLSSSGLCATSPPQNPARALGSAWSASLLPLHLTTPPPRPQARLVPPRIRAPAEPGYRPTKVQATRAARNTISSYSTTKACARATSLLTTPRAQSGGLTTIPPNESAEPLAAKSHMRQSERAQPRWSAVKASKSTV